MGVLARAADTLVRLPKNETLIKTLVQRGLPRDLFRAQPFALQQYVRSIAAEIEGQRTIKVKRETQLNAVVRIVESPFQAPFLAVVSSSPSDQKAKLLAGYLMAKATQYKLTTPGVMVGRQLPLWHFVTGSFQDKLRDKPNEHTPSMLIISNVPTEATNVKIEKVRDLLELYSDVPRIVVTTGTDPMTFAHTKLRLSVNYAVNLATNKRLEL